MRRGSSSLLIYGAIFSSCGVKRRSLAGRQRRSQDETKMLHGIRMDEGAALGAAHEFRETCHSVTFIVLVNSHQR